MTEPPGVLSGRDYLLNPHVSSVLGLHGIIQAWERPVGMDLETFLGIPGDKLEEVLGPPACRAENMFTNYYWSAVMTHLGGGAAPPQALYIALGTGTLPAQGVQRSDTALVTESLRKSLITPGVPSGDPVSVVETYFSPAADATSAITYTECGLIGVASLGSLITHAAFPYARSANVDLTVSYTIPRSAT